MATASLLPTIQSALGSAATLGYNSASAAHDVYEAYVLALLLEAASNEGWTSDLRDGLDNPTTHAVFRLGPGRLPSAGFTHIKLIKAGKVDLEAHIGVKVRGASSITHEFDLLLIRAADADACRLANRDPHYSEVVGHSEAKFYGTNLSLPIGRAVVGLAVDCHLTAQNHSNGRSVLVTNQNGRSVETLVHHYGVIFRFLIKPGNFYGLGYLVRHFRALLNAAP